MANSINLYIVDGTTVVTKQFAVNFTLGYLSKDHVKVFITGELDGGGDQIFRDFTFVNDALIEITDAITEGTEVNVRRDTPSTELQHDYQSGAVLEEANLDQSFLQTIMLVHEVFDGRGISNVTEDLNFNGKLITNLGAPVDDTDAANKLYVDNNKGTWRGTWVTTTAYVIGDFFVSNLDDSLYVVGTTHTSGASIAADIAKLVTVVDASGYAADIAQVAADAATVAADKGIVATDKALVAADLVSTNADVVLTNADATSADNSRQYAAEWANKAEDSLVSSAAGGDQVDDYSALHHATKAAASAASIDIVNLKSGRKNILSGLFRVNQRAVSGTVVLSAGDYGHDRFRGGSGGCTYTFATAVGITTITITAGTLEQEIEGLNVISGSHVLSWQGTSQGRIDAGSYGATGAVSATLTGGVNTTVEFNTGTLALPQLEKGTIATGVEYRPITEELSLCQRYYYLFGAVQMRSNNAGSVGATFSFKETMRIAPSITGSTGSTGTLTATTEFISASGTTDAFWLFDSTGAANAEL